MAEEEVKYWGGSNLPEKSTELHTCKVHGVVPNIFMYVTFDGNVTPYPYCSFCWGESLMREFPITCSKDSKNEDKVEGLNTLLEEE